VLSIRTRLFAANWKMYKTTGEAESFCQQFVNFPRPSGCEVVLFPPFTAIATVRDLMRNRGVTYGAQNLHPKESGAFTGEVSGPMLADLGCTWVLVGHSERRHVFKEADDFVCEKVDAALRAGLKANVCVGETLAERQDGRTERVVTSQLASALSRVAPDQLDRLCVSYEPVWAIGTGQNATGDQAQEVAALLRRKLEEMYSRERAAGVRVLYGGSVKPDNITDFTRQGDIDGALVGGASLVAEGFHQIITRGLAAGRA
jgi:triosephosphate isomerase